MSTQPSPANLNSSTAESEKVIIEGSEDCANGRAWKPAWFQVKKG